MAAENDRAAGFSIVERVFRERDEAQAVFAFEVVRRERAEAALQAISEALPRLLSHPALTLVERAEHLARERDAALARAEKAEADYRSAVRFQADRIDTAKHWEVRAREAEAARDRTKWLMDETVSLEAVERGEAQAEVARLREELKEVSPCMVKHSGRPQGYTCLDYRQEAEDHPEKFSEPFGEQVRRGERLCRGCRAGFALRGSGSPGSEDG